ncbi:MAG TPA: hypothetical protein VFD32_12625, partial [Dehalococcoidia bacterium]|nr:hypothetical protein [Dehalococcoidia bacterium]
GWTGSNEHLLSLCAGYGQRFTPAWNVDRVLAAILENPGMMVASLMRWAGSQSGSTVGAGADPRAPWAAGTHGLSRQSEPAERNVWAEARAASDERRRERILGRR